MPRGTGADPGFWMEGAQEPRGWHLERECPRPQAQWGGKWSGSNAPPHNFLNFLTCAFCVLADTWLHSSQGLCHQEKCVIWVIISKYLLSIKVHKHVEFGRGTCPPVPTLWIRPWRGIQLCRPRNMASETSFYSQLLISAIRIADINIANKS